MIDRMTTRRGRGPRWQFACFNHGLWRWRDEIRSAHWYLVFDGDVAVGERATLLAGAPPPCGGPVRWGGRVALVESPPDHFFDAHVARAYGPRAAGSDDDDG